jgi:hypothetical protein
MTTVKITAKFEITAWDQAVYDQPAEGTPLSEATISKTYTGAFDGTGEVRMLACQTGENTEDGAGYMAQERLAGTLDGRTGTFVMQHGAVGGPDGTDQYGFVVPGSATGQLTGLTGTCLMQHGELTLDYDL